MCRALTVLCAAPDRTRLGELKRAAVAQEWELTGGATSIEELESQVADLGPDVVVIDAVLGPQAVATCRGAKPGIRVVSVGPLSGTDGEAASVKEVRAAILGLPRPGGPVRG
jgi:ABC-type xylose transport system substrate-binding protein